VEGLKLAQKPLSFGAGRWLAWGFASWGPAPEEFSSLAVPQAEHDVIRLERSESHPRHNVGETFLHWYRAKEFCKSASLNDSPIWPAAT
jgi:hypothetical protein